MGELGDPVLATAEAPAVGARPKLELLMARGPSHGRDMCRIDDLTIRSGKVARGSCRRKANCNWSDRWYPA